MRSIAFALLLLVMAGGVVVPTAAAEQLHSTVVSWTPNDVQPGESVTVELLLYIAAGSHDPKDGTPVAGVNDVEVVIYGDGQMRWFATEERSGGRYGTEINFPKAGGWDLRVRYGAGSYGLGDEILLGKGALCVGGDLCVREQPARSVPAQGDGRPWTALALAVGPVLILALLAASLIAKRLSSSVA